MFLGHTGHSRGTVEYLFYVSSLLFLVLNHLFRAFSICDALNTSVGWNISELQHKAFLAVTSLVWNDFSNALLVYQAYSRSNTKLKLWHRDFLFFILVLMYLNTVWFQQSTSTFNCIPNHLWWYTKYFMHKLASCSWTEAEAFCPGMKLLLLGPE